jgi:predicted nucleotidyltransferase
MAMDLARKHGSRKSLSYHLMNKAKRHQKDHFSDPVDQPVELKKYFFVVQPLGNVLWLKKHAKKGAIPINYLSCIDLNQMVCIFLAFSGLS